MEVIFVFLKWVASFSHVDEETGSKMDLQNLATVMCPNILYSSTRDPTKDENFLAIRAVHELLEFQDEFWLVSALVSIETNILIHVQVPEEFEGILKDEELLSNPELSTKDIQKRCEDFLKKRDRNRQQQSFPRRPHDQPARPAYTLSPGMESRVIVDSRRELPLLQTSMTPNNVSHLQKGLTSPREQPNSNQFGLIR
jgi:hypothetical protein